MSEKTRIYRGPEKLDVMLLCAGESEHVHQCLASLRFGKSEIKIGGPHTFFQAIERSY